MGYGNVLLLDRDLDFLSDHSERCIGTDCSNPDTDLDGVPDWYEITRHLDAFHNDSFDDPDGDGLSNIMEYQYLTDPHSNDTDNDGLPDFWEINNGLDPLNATDRGIDSDDDMLANWQEYLYGTDPQNPDTDGDGFSDGTEVYQNFDPLDPNDHPLTFISLGQDVSALYILMGILFILGCYVIRKALYLRKIRRRKLESLIGFMETKRRDIISSSFRKEKLASLAPQIAEGLLYYISTGDPILAAKLSKVPLDKFDELRKTLGIPRVVFYEKEE